MGGVLAKTLSMIRNVLGEPRSSLLNVKSLTGFNVATSDGMGVHAMQAFTSRGSLLA